MIALIQQLYEAERASADMTHEARQAHRQAHTVPVLAKINAERDRLAAVVLPKSPLGDAVRYLTNQWDALQRFVDDGRLAADNNRGESIACRRDRTQTLALRGELRGRPPYRIALLPPPELHTRRHPAVRVLQGCLAARRHASPALGRPAHPTRLGLDLPTVCGGVVPATPHLAHTSAPAESIARFDAALKTVFAERLRVRVGVSPDSSSGLTQFLHNPDRSFFRWVLAPLTERRVQPHWRSA